MKKLMICVTLVVLFGAGDSLRAEPSPTVRQLMKEPMSIFDWGLFRLQSDLQEDHELDQTKEFRPLKVYVGYTAKTNVIEIALFAYPKRNFVNEVPAKDICKNVTNYVRRFLNTGMPKHMRMYTGIAKYFETSSFSMQPEKLMENIEAITRVKVTLSGSETDKPPTKTLAGCESPLMGEEILFKEQPTVEKRKQ